MPSPEVTSDTAPDGEASPTSRKLLRWLRRRLRQLLWASGALAVAAVAFAAWWLTSLMGLPDIGDPFDVAAISEPAIPDERNAFTFLRRAHEALTPLPELPRDVKNAAQKRRLDAGRPEDPGLG